MRKRKISSSNIVNNQIEGKVICISNTNNNTIKENDKDPQYIINFFTYEDLK